jgi:hypothetical protein
MIDLSLMVHYIFTSNIKQAREHTQLLAAPLTKTSFFTLKKLVIGPFQGGSLSTIFCNIEHLSCPDLMPLTYDKSHALSVFAGFRSWRQGGCLFVFGPAASARLFQATALSAILLPISGELAKIIGRGK